ncbi:MAG: IclR family transcriptional regulator [Ktedonobacteraceae bacterium]
MARTERSLIEPLREPARKRLAVRKPPLERYISTLEAIAMARDKLSLSEIALRCGLPIATTHRILSTLSKSGLIIPVGSRKRDFALGPRLLRLLHAGTDEAIIRIGVQPILNDLVKKTGHTCFLARIEGHRIVSAAWAVPARGLRSYVVPGHVMPPHAAASAKAILAFQPKSVVDHVLGDALPRLAPFTVTDKAAILQELEEVRRRGYSTCWNEIEMGLGAIACPIDLPYADVMYSLGITGVVDRLRERSTEDIVVELKAAATSLAHVLCDASDAERFEDVEVACESAVG